VPAEYIEVYNMLYKDTFKNDQLSREYKGIGQEISSEWANTMDRPGYLRMLSSNSLDQDYRNYIVALQRYDIHFSASTQVDFLPMSEEHKSGLIAYIDEHKWYFLLLKGSGQKGQKYLQIESKVGNLTTQHLASPIDVSESDMIQLKLSVEEDKILFYYSTKKHQWHKVAPSLSLGNVNSEESKINEQLDSPSAQIISVGMCVMNNSDEKIHAYFKYFKYESHL